MVKRTYSKDYSEEPENQPAFEKPSEREHLFQVTDVITTVSDPELAAKLKLDDNTVSVKCEVVGGEEEGRTLLQRLTIDEDGKGFWATRLFLKAIGESYKGAGLSIDSDRWIGRQFYADVVHNGTYANINGYNFEKKVETSGYSTETPSGDPVKDIQW